MYLLYIKFRSICIIAYNLVTYIRAVNLGLHVRTRRTAKYNIESIVTDC